jgi:hypothetical protein
MSDYSAGWPLWSEAGELLAVDDPPLSDELAADLRAWQNLFETEFHWDSGWRTAEAEERYAREAVALLDRLCRELGGDVQVELDTWPVNNVDVIARLDQGHGE